MNSVSTLKALSTLPLQSCVVDKDLFQWPPHVKVNHSVII